jgi:hypothetical protein
MKSVLFNQFSVVFFLLVLLTHVLTMIGRYGFLTKKKIGFLMPAVLSAFATIIFLGWYGFSTYWWTVICLFNLSILLLIAFDMLMNKLSRSLLHLTRLLRTFRGNLQ